MARSNDELIELRELQAKYVAEHKAVLKAEERFRELEAEHKRLKDQLQS